MNIKIEKHHEGRTVYALPTGNNARRRGTDEPVQFHVESVSRRYAHLTREGWKYSDKYDRETGATESCVRAGYGSNAGYLFFESLDDIAQYRRQLEIEEDVRKFFEWSNFWDRKLSADQLEQIHRIISNV